jgi:HrpA-like RNA helicase
MARLLRSVARTAVIAGTATSVSNRVSRHQAERWQRQGSYPSGQPEPGAAAPAQAPPAPAGMTDAIQQLKELAALKDQGILTEEEFAAQKARILST